MHSPKKDKSKVKRMVMRGKAVPQWAQDKKKVDQVVKQQMADPKFDAADIYGICLVENLDTNVIFGDSQVYHRGSSARWNRYPYS